MSIALLLLGALPLTSFFGDGADAKAKFRQYYTESGAFQVAAITLTLAILRMSH
jgi:hypothetical protein